MMRHRYVRLCFQQSLLGILGILVLGFASFPQSVEAIYTVAERRALADLATKSIQPANSFQRVAIRGDVLRISDRQFANLPHKWKRGIRKLVVSEQCGQWDDLIRTETGGDSRLFMIAKTIMIIESGCKAEVVGTGGGTNYGLFQVQAVACNDVGVTGDLLDPETNIKCAVRYLKALCSRYDRCAIAEKLVAYNAGPGGANRVNNKRAFDYVRRFDFVRDHMIEVDA